MTIHPELREFTDETDPGSIKYWVKKFVTGNRERLAGKKIIDFPAGNGVTSAHLLDIGAIPVPFDLFPEYFRLEGIRCLPADIEKGLPVAAAFADALICQEGIEHFKDQLSVLMEFNRVLKPGGMLLITTPNYSSLRAKLSYLFSENERSGHMPPNEKDDVWMKGDGGRDRIYFGHIFLTGILKLRLLASLSGFRIREIHRTRKSSTCVLLFPFLYPWIWLVNRIALNKNLRRANASGDSDTVRIYRETYKLITNPGILVNKHLMVEFIKETESGEVAGHLKPKGSGFGVT
jgi:SAM-dependent methyltransferase